MLFDDGKLDIPVRIRRLFSIILRYFCGMKKCDIHIPVYRTVLIRVFRLLPTSAAVRTGDYCLQVTALILNAFTEPDKYRMVYTCR